MTRFDNAYSRVVAAAKIVLPLVALGLISTLFLFSGKSQEGEPLPFPIPKVLDLAREQRLGAPTYSGVTSEGTRVTLAAEKLYPDPENPDIVHGEDMAARLISPDGVIYDITAQTGFVDQDKRETSFSVAVNIVTSHGYDLVTDHAVMATDLSRVKSPGPVTVIGPLGWLQAGRMVYRGDPESGSEAVVDFTDGVRLLYKPR